MKHRSMAIMPVIAAMFLAPAAHAKSIEGTEWDASERFLLRARAISVMPEEDSTTTLGGSVTAGDQVVPELDLTYFLTDHWGLELIAAVTPHEMGVINSGAGNVDLDDVWLLPPTLTAQYHFNPHGDYRPYAGAGFGYIWYFDESNGAVGDVEYDDGISYVLQAGMDIAIDDAWAFNVDVKKLFHQTDVTLKNNAGGVIGTADVDLDPWIVGVGLAYRF
jgi:outer membrane protein